MPRRLRSDVGRERECDQSEGHGPQATGRFARLLHLRRSYWGVPSASTPPVDGGGPPG